MSNVKDRDLVGFVKEAQQKSGIRLNCPTVTTWNGVVSLKTNSVPRAD